MITTMRWMMKRILRIGRKKTTVTTLNKMCDVLLRVFMQNIFHTFNAVIFVKI